MILDMSEKWRNSTVATKIATIAMALATVLMLIINILFIANAGVSGFYIFSFIVTLLLAFGLYKVNRIASVITSILGVIALIYVILIIWAFAAANSTSGGFFGFLFGIINSIIPASVKALLGIFVLPYILTIIAWICLIIGGKDFRK